MRTSIVADNNVCPTGLLLIALLLLMIAVRPAKAASPRDVLPANQWAEVDRSVDRGLAYLAATQQPDGSFPAMQTGQPAVTALCAMAFLSAGYLPDRGQYSQNISRAIEYVLSSQKPDGLLTRVPVRPNEYANRGPSHTAIYNHAIAGLLLSEAYGIDPRQGTQLRQAIERAIKFTLPQQNTPKRNAAERGGWRYVVLPHGVAPTSDLSVTSWQLLFLRSAKNAGFEVPAQTIDDALQFVKRCFDETAGTFRYYPNSTTASRAMAGAGMLGMSLGGVHENPLAAKAGEWLLRRSNDTYDNTLEREKYGNYHYGVFYCAQGMYQLGGKYWQSFYPTITQVLLRNQNGDGSWSSDSDAVGTTYTTALIVLALRTPHETLPIFQR